MQVTLKTGLTVLVAGSIECSKPTFKRAGKLTPSAPKLLILSLLHKADEVGRMNSRNLGNGACVSVSYK